MDGVKFLFEVVRMCRQYPDCRECPLHLKKCHLGGRKTVEECREMVAAVEKWSEEHPLKTNGMKFLYDNREHIRTYHRWDNGCKPYIEVHIEAEWWDAEYKEGDE